MVRRALLALLLLVPAAPVHAAGGAAASEGMERDGNRLGFVFGPDFDTGTYGSQRRVSVLSWQSSATWNPWTSTALSLDLPYLVQRAPAGTIGGHRTARKHVGSGPDETTQGGGDAVLSVEQVALEQDDHVPVEVGVSGRIKLPTASVARGLGSGVADYTFEGDVTRTLGKFHAELRAGYSVVGSPGRVSVNGVRETVRYRNIWLASASLAYDFSDRFALGTTFHAERSVEKQLPPDEDVTLYGSYRFLPHFRLHMGLLRGLSRSSPDWGSSLALGIEL